MKTDRVRSLAEARGDYQPRTRRPPREPAHVLEDDPLWLHQGLTLRLPLRGEQVDFFGIGIMGSAVGRSTESVRRMIRDGVMPEARYRTPGRGVAAQKRLWTRSEVLASAAAMDELGLYRRRPRRWGDSELPTLLAPHATA